LNQQARPADQAAMHRMSPEAINQVAAIIAEAAKLPLRDAAFALWRQQARLDTLEGRPTEEEVRINRAMTPEQWAAKYRDRREHADNGPMFVHLARAYPHADEADIRRAILAAVKFDDACFKHFQMDRDFWECVVRAVAEAARKYPDYLESTYRDARNHVAYHMK
jgi:hypothetical protein